MKILQASFAGSSAINDKKPAQHLPEFAFIGRSNVGKSSLINCLCNHNSLARTSATPGKTQCINHFLINNKWYLVDLPGYGYAKLSQKMREKLMTMIKGFITKSEEMLLLFVLLDSRHDIQKIDLEFLIWLGENGIPFSIIFTKGDKSGVNALSSQIAKNKKILSEYWDPLPEIFVTSSEDGRGREEVLNYIGNILKSYSTTN